jgi:hypothetical protein
VQQLFGDLGHASGQGGGALRIETEQGFYFRAKLRRNLALRKELIALCGDHVGKLVEEKTGEMIH